MIQHQKRIQVPQLAASNGSPGNSTIAFVLGLGEDLLDDHSWGGKRREGLVIGIRHGASDEGRDWDFEAVGGYAE